MLSKSNHFFLLYKWVVMATTTIDAVVSLRLFLFRARCVSVHAYILPMLNNWFLRKVKCECTHVCNEFKQVWSMLSTTKCVHNRSMRVVEMCRKWYFFCVVVVVAVTVDDNKHLASEKKVCKTKRIELQLAWNKIGNDVKLWQHLMASSIVIDCFRTIYFSFFSLSSLAEKKHTILPFHFIQFRLVCCVCVSVWPFPAPLKITYILRQFVAWLHAICFAVLCRSIEFNCVLISASNGQNWNNTLWWNKIEMQKMGHSNQSTHFVELKE